jgi:hypothetical protein
MSLAPPTEAVYSDLDTAIKAIQLHAKEHGYTVSKYDRKALRLVLACDRAGQYRANGKDLEVHASR